MSALRLAPRRNALVAALAVIVLLLLSVALRASADVSDTPGRTWATNGRVLAIENIGGLVYIGGTFTAVVDLDGVSHPAGNIAVFNPSTGSFNTAWSATANGSVNAIAASGNTLYLGGGFSQVNGANHRKLAAVNLTTGAVIPSWKPSADGLVETVVALGGSVYAGGFFFNITDASGAHAQPFIARLDGTTGALDQTWHPAPDARVRRIMPSTDGSRLFVGGDFTTVSGAPGSVALVSLVTTSGAVDPLFREGTNNGNARAPVFDLATDGTHLLVAAAGGGGGCTLQDPTRGTTVWSHKSNGDMQSVEIIGSIAYCGGHFNGSASFDGVDRTKLAAVDLTTGTILDYAPVVNSALGIWSMGSDATHLFIGGDFTKVSGISQAHFASFSQAGTQALPTAPRSLTGQAGDSAAYLSWLPPTNDGGSTVKSYRVYRKTAKGTARSVGRVDALAFTDPSAVDGTTYTYTVAAVNGIGEGPQSSGIVVTPQQGVITPPGAPVGLASTSLPGAVSLTWNPPASNGGSPVTGYQVLRSSTPGTEILLTTLGTVTSYVDSAVTVQARYYYTVRAINAKGTSSASNETTVSPNSGVPSPPVLSGTATSGTVTLTWPAVVDNGSPLTKQTLVRDGIRIATLTPDVRTYVDKAVVHGTTYRYQLKATNSAGSSNFSNSVTLQVP
jgi:fibronectin type 3 domain-containing protein